MSGEDKSVPSSANQPAPTLARITASSREDAARTAAPHAEECWREIDLLGVDCAQARKHLARILPRADAVSSKPEGGDAGQTTGQVLFDLPLCFLSLE